MAIRDKMAASVQPHLRPGEQLQAVFGAQTTSQYLALIGFIPFLIVNRYRVVAVTDQRILVLDAGKWGMSKGRTVIGELPRATTMGPGSGVWHVVAAGPEQLRV